MIQRDRRLATRACPSHTLKLRVQSIPQYISFSARMALLTRLLRFQMPLGGPGPRGVGEEEDEAIELSGGAISRSSDATKRRGDLPGSCKIT
jgi:hypothetical protein